MKMGGGCISCTAKEAGVIDHGKLVSYEVVKLRLDCTIKHLVLEAWKGRCANALACSCADVAGGMPARRQERRKQTTNHVRSHLEIIIVKLVDVTEGIAALGGKVLRLASGTGCPGKIIPLERQRNVLKRLRCGNFGSRGRR